MLVNKNTVVHCLFTVHLPMLKIQLMILIISLVNAEINITILINVNQLTLL